MLYTFLEFLEVFLGILPYMCFGYVLGMLVKNGMSVPVIVQSAGILCIIAWPLFVAHKRR